MKMNSKGEILVIFPAQAAITDTTCPPITVARLYVLLIEEVSFGVIVASFVSSISSH